MFYFITAICGHILSEIIQLHSAFLSLYEYPQDIIEYLNDTIRHFYSFFFFTDLTIFGELKVSKLKFESPFE